jgi:acetyltransferase-like isoleucine patch superfamily enzyme
MNRFEMKRTRVGRLAFYFYRWPVVGKVLARIAVKLEGGQLTSRTLRDILAEYWDVSVGDYSYGSLLVPGRADRRTSIGRYVSIGDNVRRFGAAHPMDSPSMHPYWYNPDLGFVGPQADVQRSVCRIGDEAWIGANVTILPRCNRIGTGAVIGAGSVVTKDVPPFAIALGNPARVVGYRFDEEHRTQLLASRFWELEPSHAKALIQELVETWN